MTPRTGRGSSSERRGTSIERWGGAATGRNRTVAFGGLVWTVANARDASVDFAAQVLESFDLLDAHLREAGSSRAQLLSVNVILADIGDRAAFEPLWLDWIGPVRAHWPQRACFQSGLAPGLRVELVATAARDRVT